MTFWDLVQREWLRVVITIATLYCLWEGYYKIDDFIAMVERVAINLSLCQ